MWAKIVKGESRSKAKTKFSAMALPSRRPISLNCYSRLGAGVQNSSRESMFYDLVWKRYGGFPVARGMIHLGV